MKLDEVLDAVSDISIVQDHSLVFLRGLVEPDHDTAFFRLYKNPQARRSYLLIRKEDVAGDIHELTKEEALHAGFVGVKIHHFPLKFGTEIRGVSVKIHRVGDPVPPRSSAIHSNATVCCCDNCTDIGTCNSTDDVSTCNQVGTVCASSNCS